MLLDFVASNRRCVNRWVAAVALNVLDDMGRDLDGSACLDAAHGVVALSALTITRL